VLVSTTTAENPLKENTFVIWRGGEPADFGSGQYRMSATNSGTNFAAPPEGAPASGDCQQMGAQGHQADIDTTSSRDDLRGTGRNFLFQRGRPSRSAPMACRRLAI
jgi:hypothetical protein